MTVKLAPSILAADFARLGQQVAEAEQAGADRIHVDVMDGHFVPNLSMGPAIVQSLRRVTHLPLDVPVDRVLEQDGADDALAGEAGARHDARPHLMHDREHLCLAGPRVLLDSVGTQRAGRAATALIQRRDEPGMCLHLLQLFVVGHLGHLVLRLFR